ncbi:MAG: arginine--tRNA ligase [Actinomycetota bacterium]|nr:arginine--tRNA ligase [Actinomycetota bacterium]
MIEQQLSALIRGALEAAAPELGLEPPLPAVELDRPRQKAFGDFSTNVALGLARRIGRKPRDVAEIIVAHLPASDLIVRAEVAGPGFINLYVARTWLHDVLRDVVARGPAYGFSPPGTERAQIEYVSANPTGPLHVGHGRNAVIGDALARVLDAAGMLVEREYYFNDAGRQMELFTASVEARLLQLHGRDAQLPEEGYAGEYITELAEEIDAVGGERLLSLPEDERRAELRAAATERMFAMIRATLERLRVRIDTYFSERSLHERGAIRDAVERLRASDLAYEADGAVFFRSTAFGDDKDRVLIRSNGEPTYFAADCAYLVDKFDRGLSHLIYVWGADHHGDVKRIKGAAQALGYDPDAVEIVLYQFVALSRGGERTKMSKRAGDIVTLDELLDEVGPDAVRFTLLAHSSDSAINFDIEAVKRQSMDNPVFYVQYGHARIASILRTAADRGIELRKIGTVDLGLLGEEEELDLLREIAEMDDQVQAAAALRAPSRLAHYAERLAAQFHRFYAERRVVTDDAELTQARLWLCVAAKQTIANVLGLLGVSAPEAMHRTEESESEAADG